MGLSAAYNPYHAFASFSEANMTADPMILDHLSMIEAWEIRFKNSRNIFALLDMVLKRDRAIHVI